MKIKSYAKVNFGLSVFRKQKDHSKHDFESIFILLDSVYDDIEIFINNRNYDEVRYYNETGEIFVYSKLVYCMLDYMRKTYCFKDYFKINIRKRIPIGGGLGGGSSNAASIMRMIMEIEKIKNINVEEIVEELGTDIPFFLSGYRIAYVSKSGTSLKDLTKLFKLKYEIHLMDINVNTKLIYELFDSNKYHVIKNNYWQIINDLKRKKMPDVYNDLQESCFTLYPNIKHKYTELTNNGYFALLSGAGSSFICIKNKEKK
ncbi:4-(cytidine 5'-diphospho)-2-C-methyl-D-erythritol kinase [Ureaplasma canigenitalium]|uniref:4-(cytidine 5'-diphospho)-2-C-methyl-D-erythritol kinase n=1 Tax=Ureaplasma canigenitalium TaxID=42092 RepID=UPI0004E12CA1|nr:4-(cytidine 5'-diphospho)-2-C-methyl-D-erythritol kinase [Ureaplasma canigenitalium]